MKIKAYVADPKDALSNDVIGADRYRLDIDLGTIAFLHHHQMNVEHVLAMKLKQMYEHYTVRTQQRIVHQLSEKVRLFKLIIFDSNKCSLFRSKH